MLTIKELALLAPAALSTTPAAHCSARYSMVPTIDAIKMLEQNGFALVDAKQQRCLNPAWDADKHAMHRVVMRMKGTEKLTKRQMTLGVIPELLITNSSDGSCTFEIAKGILRLICSNGLVVMEKEDALTSVHKNLSMERVLERALEVAGSAQSTLATIQQWSERKLTDAQVQQFATEALALRMGDKAAAYDPMTLVEAKRTEDAGSTLWSVYNRAQENGMNGALEGRSANGRAIRGHRITGISAEMEYNKLLWALTEKFATEG